MFQGLCGPFKIWSSTDRRGGLTPRRVVGHRDVINHTQVRVLSLVVQEHSQGGEKSEQERERKS